MTEKKLDCAMSRVYITPNDGKTVKSDQEPSQPDTSGDGGAAWDDGELGCQDGAGSDDRDALDGTTHWLCGAGVGR